MKDCLSDVTGAFGAKNFIAQIREYSQNEHVKKKFSLAKIISRCFLFSSNVAVTALWLREKQIMSFGAIASRIGSVPGLSLLAKIGLKQCQKGFILTSMTLSLLDYAYEMDKNPSRAKIWLGSAGDALKIAMIILGSGTVSRLTMPTLGVITSLVGIAKFLVDEYYKTPEPEGSQHFLTNIFQEKIIPFARSIPVKAQALTKSVEGLIESAKFMNASILVAGVLRGVNNSTLKIYITLDKTQEFLATTRIFDLLDYFVGQKKRADVENLPEDAPEPSQYRLDCLQKRSFRILGKASLLVATSGLSAKWIADRGLLNLSKAASALGKYRVFGMLNHLALTSFINGALGLGLVSLAIDSGKKLLNREDTKRNSIGFFHSSVDLTMLSYGVLAGASLTSPVMIALGFLSAGLGVWSFLYNDAHPEKSRYIVKVV